MLPGDGRPSQTADELVRFSAEHRTADDFNRTGDMWGHILLIDHKENRQMLIPSAC
jgi:hypothetical protein